MKRGGLKRNKEAELRWSGEEWFLVECEAVDPCHSIARHKMEFIGEGWTIKA